jgi:uncharacterized protein HemX
VALLLLRTLGMSEPPVEHEHPVEGEHHVERHVVHETVSTTSTRSTAITMIIVIAIALGLIIWIVTQMR